MTWEFCTVRSWPHFFFPSLRAPRSSRAPTTHLPKVYGTHTSHGSCICSPHCIVLALRVSCGLSFHLPLVLCNILFPRLMRRRSRALTSASRVTPWSTSNCFSPSVVLRTMYFHQTHFLPDYAPAQIPSSHNSPELAKFPLLNVGSFPLIYPAICTPFSQLPYARIHFVCVNCHSFLY